VAKKAPAKAAKPSAKKALKAPTKAAKPAAKKSAQRPKAAAPVSKKPAPKATATRKAKPAKKEAAPQSELHFNTATGKADVHAKPVIHGPDMHFIPGQGQQGQITIKDKVETEQAYHHSEEIALHQEQERVKQNLATRLKKVFTTPRQS
jgi:hypothetical protein